MEMTSLRITQDGPTLEAAFHSPTIATTAPRVPAAVVCHPHPLRGGDMDNNVVAAVVRGLLSAELAALRFNFRGVGGSGGSHEGGVGERDDVTAALRAAAARPEVDAQRLGLAGYSFGAMVAAAAATDPAVRALVLVSPGMRDGAVLDALAALTIPVLLLAGSEDAACPRERIDELGPLAHVECRIVPSVDHFWWGDEGTITAAVAEFFGRTLAAPGTSSTDANR